VKARHRHTLYLAAAVVLGASSAFAHTRGLSQSEFVVQADGSVDAEIVLASTESLSSVVLDADHDGTVTADEVASKIGDLRRVLLDGVEVDAGARACPGEFRGAELTEGDGLRLTATYRCGPDASRASRIGVTLFFLTELRAHKHVARITWGSASAQQRLNGANRYLALDLPRAAAPDAADTPRPRVDGWRRTAVVVTTAVFVIAMIALFAWRYRTAARKKR
jgi:hypothetical protein